MADYIADGVLAEARLPRARTARHGTFSGDPRTASLHEPKMLLCGDLTSTAQTATLPLHIVTSAITRRNTVASKKDFRFQAPMRVFSHQGRFSSLGTWNPCWTVIRDHKLLVFESSPIAIAGTVQTNHQQLKSPELQTPLGEPMCIDLYKAKCTFNLTMKEQGSAAYHWMVYMSDADSQECPTPLIQQNFVSNSPHFVTTRRRDAFHGQIGVGPLPKTLTSPVSAIQPQLLLIAEFQINTEQELVRLVETLRQIREDSYQHRKHIQKRTQDSKERATALIQAQWRSYLQRRKYRMYRNAVINLQSHFRRRKARKQYEQRKTESKKMAIKDHRNRVVYEIATTEESYIEQMDILIRVYLRPLRSLFHESHKTLRRAHIDDIFGNIEEIFVLHEKFLEQLKQVTDTWDESNGCLGELFMALACWLNVYIPYCNNWDIAKKMLAKARKIPLFSEFLDSVRSLRISKKNDISSFLILPIQRIPRYELLLKDLIRHTWPNHPDLPMLHLALGKITACAKTLNRAKMYHDNKSKIEALAKKLRKGTSLRDEFRTYLGEGPAIYKEPHLGKHVNVYLFLFTDQLLVTTTKQERKFRTSPTPHSAPVKFDHLVNISLDTVSLCDREDSVETSSTTLPVPGTLSPAPSLSTCAKKEYMISLIVTGQLSVSLHKDQEHIFFFESADLKSKWLSDIREAMDELEKIKAADSDITGLLSVGDDDEMPVLTMHLSQNGNNSKGGVHMRKRYASAEVLVSARVGSLAALNDTGKSSLEKLANDQSSIDYSHSRRKSADSVGTRSEGGEDDISENRVELRQSPVAKQKQRSVNNLLSLFG